MYSHGNGHLDLANQLGIDQAVTLTLPGSCNSRIIRTTLKDSYAITTPTLYIIGVTFLNRTELPVGAPDSVEGAWLSFQNSPNPSYVYQDHWNNKDSTDYINLMIKSSIESLKDRYEHLVYQLCGLIDSVKSRGHQILIYQQADPVHVDHLTDDMLDPVVIDLLKNNINIIEQLKWLAVPWQFKQGVHPDSKDLHLPKNIRHPASGEHGPLNNFLLDYIKTNDLSV
jgi:hypothetical protein